MARIGANPQQDLPVKPASWLISSAIRRGPIMPVPIAMELAAAIIGEVACCPL